MREELAVAALRRLSFAEQRAWLALQSFAECERDNLRPCWRDVERFAALYSVNKHLLGGLVGLVELIRSDSDPYRRRPLCADLVTEEGRAAVRRAGGRERTRPEAARGLAANALFREAA